MLHSSQKPSTIVCMNYVSVSISITSRAASKKIHHRSGLLLTLAKDQLVFRQMSPTSIEAPPPMPLLQTFSLLSSEAFSNTTKLLRSSSTSTSYRATTSVSSNLTSATTLFSKPFARSMHRKAQVRSVFRRLSSRIAQHRWLHPLCLSSTVHSWMAFFRIRGSLHRVHRSSRQVTLTAWKTTDLSRS